MPIDETIFPLPRVQPDVTAFLKNRRSNLSKFMHGPGPDRGQIEALLKIAARVPDHRKLAPWRFIVFEGAARQALGAHIQEVFRSDHPGLDSEKYNFERARLLRAPCVIAVVSSPVTCPRGTPEWEQILSCGAVCFNLLLAAQAAGFAAQWLTEWFAYDARVNAAVGLTEKERIAGYIYIGTTKQRAKSRQRPDVESLINYWSK